MEYIKSYTFDPNSANPDFDTKLNDIKKFVKSVNGSTPDENGNVIIDISNSVNTPQIENETVTDSVTNGNILVNGQEITVFNDSEVMQEIAGKADANHTHDFSSIANKPVTYPPSSHVHEITDIDGLQEVLDSKANVGSILGGQNNIPTTFTGYDATVTNYDSLKVAVSGGYDYAPCIQKAIDNVAAAGGGDVYIPSGIYKIGRTITVKPKVQLRLSWGAVLIPIADVHVIRLNRKARITGGMIDATNLTNFSHACIYLDGSENFGANAHGTAIKDINLKSDKLRGYGIYFYSKGKNSDGTSQNICFVQVMNVNVMYFDKGIYMLNEDDANGGIAWNNGNMFNNIGFAACKYDLYLQGTDASGNAGNNFINLNFQPVGASGYQTVNYVYMDHCGYNQVQGMMWDYQNLVDASKGVVLTANTNYNYFISNFGKANSHISNLGTNNVFASGHL